jgi:sugar phosphate isomerase/epimerase
MQLGVCCGSVDRWHLIRKTGYDYAEAYFSGITLADDAEFQKICETKKNDDISVEALNGMFTPKFILIGEERTSPDEVREFCEKGFYRAKTLGGEFVILGSGKARSIPEGMEKERAEAEFVDLLRLCGDIAKKNDMKLAIEPLRYEETNFINTVAESAAICRLAAHDSVGTIVDFYHFHCNGESLETLKDAKDKLFHAHIARPNVDRMVPTEIDREICALWAKALREIGYDARLTLEARYSDDYEGDLKKAYPIMKMFQNA